MLAKIKFLVRVFFEPVKIAAERKLDAKFMAILQDGLEPFLVYWLLLVELDGHVKLLGIEHESFHLVFRKVFRHILMDMSDDVNLVPSERIIYAGLEHVIVLRERDVFRDQHVVEKLRRDTRRDRELSSWPDVDLGRVKKTDLRIFLIVNFEEFLAVSLKSCRIAINKSPILAEALGVVIDSEL